MGRTLETRLLRGKAKRTKRTWNEELAQNSFALERRKLNLSRHARRSNVKLTGTHLIKGDQAR